MASRVLSFMNLLKSMATPVAALLVLAACQGGEETGPDAPSSQAPSEGTVTDTAVAASAGGNASLGPPALVPESERGEAGARNVLISFARAIELSQNDNARALLTATAKEEWSAARFNALFSGLEDISFAVPSGTLEGAAGSSYYTSQASITAIDAEGRPIRIEGPIVLRRVNDVPGATAEQLRWKIASIDFVQTH